MSEMISLSSGFQYSVNIAYDLYADDKLRNFIPTKSSLLLLESILLSTNIDSNNRARILVGAYGKGKSHIVLAILAILMKRDFELFEKMSIKLDEAPRIRQLINNYYESKNKILPVVITGANTSLTQAFLLSLQRTLNENNLVDVMPETNFQAAIATMQRWKNEFPDTLKELEEAIGKEFEEIVSELKDYDVDCYKKFEEIYPKLTSGSTFNPFLGFDVVELYESVAEGLKEKGYSGIYVVYDEFSKYLEANIKTASVSDTKMLQDFAEKCTRSGSLQLHLMLISHKEISNYIDKLPKQKVDGWRGISERFEHVHLNNNFSQSYELIRTVIQKDDTLWDKFYSNNNKIFENLYDYYSKHQMYSDTSNVEVKKAIEGCYPLHPVSTFILPRLSERVAQNERTLFTFLSAKGDTTLSSLLKDQNDDVPNFVTPDKIFDYFEPLFRKEMYSSNLHDYYLLTKLILDKLSDGSLESRIVKTISLIYTLEQFEKLSPTASEIITIFSLEFDKEKISSAIDNLIDKECVIYLKKSNGFLKLKETSGVNLKERIEEVIEKERYSTSIKNVLNNNNFDSFMYPSRYNSNREMTRYFTYEFIDSKELDKDIDWVLKANSLENKDADGYIFAIIPESEDELERVKEVLKYKLINASLCIFVIPTEYKNISDIVQEFNAVSILKDQTIEDKILFEEYEVIYEDLLDVINGHISNYIRPENKSSTYHYNAKVLEVGRKSELTEILSIICDEIYSKTPIINNESINRNELTSVSYNSRNKIVAALLRNELDVNLGLVGNGQEVSMMRSTLVRTGIMKLDTYPNILEFETNDSYLTDMLKGIIEFIFKARKLGSVSFQEIYNYLIFPQYNIGLRLGLIPIYLSVVFHKFKQEIVIKNNIGQLPLNADTLEQINARPELFELHFLEWNEEKEQFITKMDKLFSDFIIDSEKQINSYDYIVYAMKRWYLSLPKFTKESKRTLDNEKIDKRDLSLLSSLRSEMNGQDLLFEYIPKEYGYTEFNIGIFENIAESKKYFDELLEKNKEVILSDLKNLFSDKDKDVSYASLYSVIKDWLDTLDNSIHTQVFHDGTDKCLKLFKNITADSDFFVIRLSKLATDLRIEDWNSETYSVFKQNIRRYKNTAENYIPSDSKPLSEENFVPNQYQIAFMSEDGSVNVKQFDKLERSKRSDLLFNAIESQLSSMGQAISNAEKRQVLIEILDKLL